MTHINPSAYRLPPSPHKVSGLEITEDELSRLVSLLEAIDSTQTFDFKNSLGPHIGSASTYSMKSQVKQGLKIIYDKLSEPQTSASEKSLIYFKLQERVVNCTPGFHDGVNAIVDGFFAAKSIDDLVFRVRQDIVARMASRLTDEVHANNRCFTLAAHNYGVRPLNSQDSYVGSLSDEKIISELAKTFEKEMTPVNMLYRLEEQLRGQLGNAGYSGVNPNGYAPDEISAMDEQLIALFHSSQEVQPLFLVKNALDEKNAQRKAILTQVEKVLKEAQGDAISENRMKQLLTFITGNDALFKKANENFLDKNPTIKEQFEQAKSAYQAIQMTSLNESLVEATAQYKQSFHLQNENKAVKDLNWLHIRHILWQGIKEEAYFTLEHTEQKAIDAIVDQSLSAQQIYEYIQPQLQTSDKLSNEIWALLNCTDNQTKQDIFQLDINDDPSGERSIKRLSSLNDTSLKASLTLKNKERLLPALKKRELLTILDFISGFAQKDIEELKDFGLFHEWMKQVKPGQNLLHYAIFNHNNKLALKLIDLNIVNVNQADNNGQTPFHAAVISGHTKMVQMLLATNKIDVNQTDNNGATPLEMAIKGGHTEIFQMLLETNKVDVNQANNNGETPFHTAVIFGHTKIAQMLLKTNKIDVNQTDNNGATSLEMAIKGGHTEIFQILLETNKVDVNQADNSGETPLHLAARSGHTKIFQILLETNKVDVNQANNSGETPLHLAARSGHTEIFQMLLETNKVDVNQANKNGETPLSLALDHNKTEIIKKLIAVNDINLKGINPDKPLPGGDGDTLLSLAVQNGHVKVVEILLETNKVDINQAVRGNTLLLLASRNGYTEIVKMLLKRKNIDVNKSNEYDQTPLQWAIHNGHTAIVELLLAIKEINVNQSLLFAAASGRTEIFKMLLETNKVDVNEAGKYGQTALRMAAQIGYIEIVKMLLETNKVDVNQADENGNTALYRATENGHTEIVKMLLKTKNIDVNKSSKFTYGGHTPLLKALEKGHTAIVELLLATSKVDVNQANISGRTPLHLAVESGHTEIVKILLTTNKVDVNQPGTYERNTPLHLAAENGHTEIVKLLLATNKVDVNQANNSGETPLHLAARFGHTEIVKILLETRQIDVNKANKDGKTPLNLVAAQHYITGNRNAEILDLLSAAQKNYQLKKSVHEELKTKLNQIKAAPLIDSDTPQTKL